VKKVYPDGIHAAIASFLRREPDLEVRTATLDEPEHALSKGILESTDVLTWWGHIAHREVGEEVVDRIHQRVLDGMGLLVLHASHDSKIFRRLMGTRCDHHGKCAMERERIWVVERAHPIVNGLGEFFDIPAPDTLVLLSAFTNGEVFRSGCCFCRGRGKIFYFRPGHETLPIYYHGEVQRVFTNAIRWLAPAS
jgi:trehalose utilization protein